MEEPIKPSTEALKEALQLAEEILRNIELSELPLSNIALKASRLARLLNEFAYQKLFEYEAGGYPSTPTGIPPDVWQLAQAAGRTYQQQSKEGETKTYAFITSIEELEQQIETGRLGLDAARDRDVSVSSANPNQYVMAGTGNWYERQRIHNQILEASKRLSGRKTYIYQYVLRKNYEIKFSGIASDAFSRMRKFVDTQIGIHIPDAVQKFTAIYENLLSENPEDWSNAVHSCRRVLQDLADSVFPPQDEDRIEEKDGKTKRIKLGSGNYINRIMCFVEDKASSDRFNDLVGSHIGFLGDRLDAIFRSAQKGSHSVITTKEEADRYMIYTYLIVGDILSLKISHKDKNLTN
jgi:hypothetical protein